MALGANKGQVLRLIVNQAMWMAGAGLGIGVIASITLVRLLPSFSHLLYGVGQSDPFTLLGASAVLLIAAVVACYVPARRAMRIDPIDCLRIE
jgi:putative ABC transport system permease protein